MQKPSIVRITCDTNDAVENVMYLLGKYCCSEASVVHVNWKNIANIDLQLYKVRVNLKLNYMTLFTVVLNKNEFKTELYDKAFQIINLLKTFLLTCSHMSI